VLPVASRLQLDTGLAYEVLEWAPVDPACEHTVLLLHGYLDHAWGWHATALAGLAGRYHLLAPSFRGHGQSDWVGDGSMYYFLDYAADLHSVVEQRARRRLSIVGHSMGGMVAAYFSGTYPERVERTALLEGLSIPESPTGPDRLRESTNGRAQTLSRRGTRLAPGSRRFARFEDAVARMLHHDPLLDASYARLLCEHGCLELPSGEWVFRHDPLLSPRTPMGFELAVAERFWSKVKGEVLYVEGTSSSFRLGDEERDRRLACFPKARSVTMKDAGHMMLRHHPAALAQLLIPFLDGQAPLEPSP